MLTADQIEAIGDQAQQLLSPVVEYLIEDIAKRISEAGQLTSTAAYQTWRLQQLGVSQRQLKKELRKRLKVSHRDLRRLLEQSAEAGYDYDIRKHPYVQTLPFKDNAALQSIVSAAVQLADDDLNNITKTMGFVGPDGQARELTDAYRNACDFAFKKVSTGAQDYASAIRQATRNLSEKGIVTIDYDSGAHTSLEAAVRRSVVGGLGLMQEQISRQNHDDFGCDGWEISAHAASAPDHEPIQGRQYSDEAYERLNNSLVRRIGTLNCGHAAFPIILGVDSPQYSQEELEKFRQENEKGIDYEGRHYTRYEATQRQRKLERVIRKQKRRILVDEATGDQENLKRNQIKYQVLDQEYKRFSKAAGLRTQHEWMEMAGFGPGQAKAAEESYIDIANQADSMYDTGSTDGNVKAFMRDLPIRQMIGSDQYPLSPHSGRQNKHIPGTHEFEQYANSLKAKGQFGPSRITITEDDINALVQKYHGKGVLLNTKDGTWRGIERITVHPGVIGVAVNNLTGAEADTTTFTIRYSKDGFHVVPDYPSRKGEKSK